MHTCSNIVFWKANFFCNSKIISKFCWIGKDCDQNGERMSKNDEKMPYLHKVTRKYF